MSALTLSRWDPEGRYYLPEAILEKLKHLVARRKNKTHFMAIVAYILRMHGLRPSRSFPLDRRALAAEIRARAQEAYRELKITEDHVRTVIAQLEEFEVVERDPDTPTGYQRDVHGLLIRDSYGKPMKRPVIFRFTRWMWALLQVAIKRRKPKSPIVNTSSKIQSSSRMVTRTESLTMGDEVPAPAPERPPEPARHPPAAVPREGRDHGPGAMDGFLARIRAQIAEAAAKRRVEGKEA